MNQRVTLIFIFYKPDVVYKRFTNAAETKVCKTKAKTAFILKAVTLNRKWNRKAVSGFYRIGVELDQPEIRK